MSATSGMRVVVVGGAGNFGARIVRALRGDPTIELVIAGRRKVPARTIVCGCGGIARRDVFARLH